jgi:hypothetical protein
MVSYGACAHGPEAELAPQEDASNAANSNIAIFPCCPSVIASSFMGYRNHDLVRLITFVRKVLCIPHHLHDLKGGGCTRLGIGWRRNGADRFHAADCDYGRNKSSRENDGSLAHLALLSEELSVNPAAVKLQVPPPFEPYEKRVSPFDRRRSVPYGTELSFCPDARAAACGQKRCTTSRASLKARVVRQFPDLTLTGLSQALQVVTAAAERKAAAKH